MSEGERPFENAQDDGDDDGDDVLSMEEELCLRLDTMRDFFLQQLKAIKDSLFSSQTKVHKDLKAFKESILTEELNFYRERLEAKVTSDFQLLEENCNSAKRGVVEMVKAVGESVTKRMDAVDRILYTLASRITAMEAEVHNTVPSFQASTPPRRAHGLLSRAEALSSTQVTDVGQDTEIFLDLQSVASSSPISPGQRAVLTTATSFESSSDQNPERDEALSSTQVSDVGRDMEISLDLQSLPLTQTGSSGLQRQPPAMHKRKLSQSPDDLEPELSAKIRPYMRLRHTRQEKLTGFQAAFFNLQMDRLNITGMFTFSFPLYAEAKCIHIWVLTCLFEYLFFFFIQTPRALQTRQKS